MTACTQHAETIVAERFASADLSPALAKHLAACPPCQEFQGAARAAREALRLPEQAAPDDWPQLAARIAAVRRQAELRVVLSCAFCHDRLERAAAAYCAACLAPHHADCFREHGQCSAPGCAETHLVRAERARPRRSPRSLVFLGLALTGLGAAAWAGLTSSAPPVQPRSLAPRADPVIAEVAPPAPPAGSIVMEAAILDAPAEGRVETRAGALAVGALTRLLGTPDIQVVGQPVVLTRVGEPAEVALGELGPPGSSLALRVLAHPGGTADVGVALRTGSTSAERPAVVEASASVRWHGGAPLLIEMPGLSWGAGGRALLLYLRLTPAPDLVPAADPSTRLESGAVKLLSALPIVRVSLSCRAHPIRPVLQELAALAERDLVVAASVGGHVTLQRKGLPPLKALAAVARAARLELNEGPDGLLRVQPSRR